MTITSRRSLLRRLGAAALPLLASPPAARAAGRKRLFIVAAEQGTVEEEFWPRGTGADLAALEFGKVSSPLAPFAKRLLFLGGVHIKSMTEEVKGAGHEAWLAMLTGIKYAAYPGDDFIQPGGPSVDQFIAAQLQKRQPTPFPSLNVTVSTTFAESLSSRSISSVGRNQVNDAEKDPGRLFDRVFGGLGSASGQGVRLRAAKKSVLDHVARELVAYGARLGGGARRTIDAHLEGVRGIERQVGMLEAAQCAAPERPTITRLQSDFTTTEKNRIAQAQMPALIRVHSDLLINAIACDLTRVVTMALGTRGTGLGTVLSSWPGIPADIGSSGAADHHISLTHGGYGSPEAKARKAAVERFVMSQFAYVVGELERRPDPTEPGKSLLDNSAVLFINNMANGAGHNYNGVPWVLAGSCGGYFKTGRVLKSGGWASREGDYWKGGNTVPHNGVLVGLCNAMDVPVSTFGDPKYGGELPGLRG
jgi:hypothetical protein